jgi:hypothetical protein
MYDNEIQQYFETMNQVITLPGYNNACVVGDYVMEALKKYPDDLTLPKIRTMLSSINCPLILIGLPIAFYGKLLEVMNESLEAEKKLILDSRLPNSEKRFNFGLYVEFNGSKALQDYLMENKISVIDRDLTETGLLTISPKETI